MSSLLDFNSTLYFYYIIHFSSVLQCKICQLLQNRNGGLEKQFKQDHPCFKSEASAIV